MSIQIVTPRLILRPPLETDFESFAKAQSDPEFKKHTGGTLDRMAAFNEFVEWRKFWERHNYCFFSVIEKDSNEWIGRVGPTKRANNKFPEFGWSIITNFQGKGYAKEAANAVISWAKEKLDWYEAYFCISCENIASQNLARTLGAINIGIEQLPEALKDKNVEVWYKAQ